MTKQASLNSKIFIPPFLTAVTFCGIGMTRLFSQTVTLNPGDDIQAAIDSNPAGTTCFLTSGDHRITLPIVPQTGDTLLGEDGARFNGSKLVTNWVQSGNFWMASGQTQELPLVLMEGWPTDGSPALLEHLQYAGARNTDFGE